MATQNMTDKLAIALKNLRMAGFVISSNQRNTCKAMTELGAKAAARNTAYVAVTFRTGDMAQIHFGPLDGDMVQASLAHKTAKECCVAAGLVVTSDDSVYGGMKVS